MTEQVSTAIVEDSPIGTVLDAGPNAGESLPQPRKKKKNNKKRQQPQDRRPAIQLGTNTATRPRQRPADQGRKNQNGEPSRRQIARDNMLNFKPIASHPADQHEVTLVTEYTTKLFYDHCGRAQISLYNLMHYLPIRMRMLGLMNDAGEDFLDKLEELIDARIDDVATRMRADLQRSEKILKDNQLTAVATYSQSPKQVSLAKFTPQITKILSLLTLFDQFIAAIDGLYTNGYLRRRNREKTINQYRNEIASLIRFFMRLYNDSKDLLQQGENAKLESLLVERDDSDLPDRLDDADEAQARLLTGADRHEAETAAAA